MSATDTTVRVQWNAASEKVDATTDNAMLVLPDGPGQRVKAARRI